MKGFKLGIQKQTKKAIFIENVPRGLACNCMCPDCEEDFVAAKGAKNEWHFRHHEETDCQGGQETALHKLAKQIIADNDLITIPGKGDVSYTDPIQERPFESIKPDVKVTANGAPLFLEVFVTHTVEPKTKAFYKNGEHKSVEIDLHRYVFTTPEDLKSEVLENTDNKRILFWGKEAAAESQDDFWENPLTWAAGIVVGFLAVKWVMQKLQRLIGRW